VYDIIKDYYQYGIGKDPGFSVLEKMMSSLLFEYQLFLLAIAIFFFLALAKFIYNNTARLTDAIIAYTVYSVLFYSFYSITGHRQTIAAAATLFSFEFIKMKKFLPFLVIILLVSTIHKSALLFLPFFFIANISQPKKFLQCAILLFPLIMVFKDYISGYFKMLGGYEEYDVNEAAGTITFTSLFLLIALLALSKSRVILLNNRCSKYFYNAFGIAVVFVPLTWVNPSAMRVVQYFSIFMLLLIPEILFSFQNMGLIVRRGLTFFTVIILIILFVKSNLNAQDYSFFWENGIVV